MHIEQTANIPVLT